jgi:hypothetical protein
MVLVDPSLLLTVLQTIGLSARSERTGRATASSSNIARQERVSHPHNAAQAIAAHAPAEKVPPLAHLGNNLAFPPSRDHRLGRLTRRYNQYDGAQIPSGGESPDSDSSTTPSSSSFSETPTAESVTPQEAQTTSTATEQSGFERIHALGADDTCAPPANLYNNNKNNARRDAPQSTSLPSPDPGLATIYRYRQQQGVNLGSWFLLESWMVPSLFACASAPAVAEFDVASGWN